MSTASQHHRAPLAAAGRPRPVPVLSERLRRDTAAAHRSIEGRLDLLGSGLSLDRYRRTLQRLYGFQVPVEAQLARLAPTAPPLGVPLAARAALLARDLGVLGVTPAAIAALPRCATLPRGVRAEHFAGCLYVLEGASLGGLVIARALHARLGLRAETGTAFFTGAGQATAARWRRVVGWLDDGGIAGWCGDEVVAAACETFAALERFLTAAEGTG